MRMNLRTNPLKPGRDLAWRLITPMWIASPFFVRKLIAYLEGDPDRLDTGLGWVYAFGQFASIIVVTQRKIFFCNAICFDVNVPVLNTILYAKTLLRKDVASSSGASTESNKDRDEEENKFSSKAQIMTLMTTDVDRIAEFSFHLFSIADPPIEIVVGTDLLYSMLGIPCFIGLVVLCLFLPLNHFAGRVVINAQDNLMKARDERILGGIGMLKFMAWERSFEKRVMKVVFSAIWEASPVVVTLVSFWHFAVWRQQTLTPSIAFTSMLDFNEMRFAMNALPETFINLLQVHVSLNRIGKYLQLTELGSGKTLLLLSLLGEADIITGQVVCPRSPPDALACFANQKVTKEEWIVPGVCAYVPQSAWLRNASIKDNILFGLPFDEERYQTTLEICALISDLRILEDGDESEIGERGVNLSGGQKARVSLARAVYSRASILLFDDVLSAGASRWMLTQLITSTTL
ncbi:hypothetical protein AZE42_10977 [Rhizopogon vesiculosus]|uniref:ABC transmembrane type-1 domain-containing protein n=1 Tax=Rhizopogon vesiculosus TaxID=180088 RepID=A0A1J8Q4G3_9AGAM|nr:hypothetical protein AZE42_10977 [Rhizopogon vesiculosus]